MTDETKTLLLHFRFSRSEERHRMAFIAAAAPARVAASVRAVSVTPRGAQFKLV
jgi:hypothetical protein